VLEKGGEYPWQVRHGPFGEAALRAQGGTHWSLLVQHTELYLPAAADFLARFNFIPNWRIDDLMISLAAPQGSVGPHVDSYDVFLFQATGRRRWSISTRSRAASAFGFTSA